MLNGVSRRSNDSSEGPKTVGVLFGIMDLTINQTYMSDDNLQRRAFMVPGGVQPAQWQEKGREGRPRQAWASSAFQHVVQAAGGASEVQKALLASQVLHGLSVSEATGNR